ncbi:iron ABC transporter permease [Myroides sp. DF42-4-2]|uniref:FecCD family ABC transporter permease n=1 Tax=unclassified Myroides TaxID=2642485 RepID=UPI002574ACB9|nr:iron ABC transporter permease [Myroides sp. DF42-4-2]MDM1408080.1 iron ABC transporter permease [Myroides sp. DF42-4-2]
MKQKLGWGLGILLLLFLFALNLSWGSVKIPLASVWDILTGHEGVKSSWEYIVLHYRLPKALVAMLVGIALSVSGLLMQTLFRNPMAESYVLGVSAGAGLGVALVLMGGALLPAFISPLLTSNYTLLLTAVLGSLVLLLLILAVSKQVKNSITVLIVGLMFGSFANAVIAILSFFSEADQLKKYVVWMSGSLGNLTQEMILLFGMVVGLGVGLALLLIRPLDALLLGDTYAASLGIQVKQTRNLIIITASLLAGGATAFVGPIAFIGLAVPHMARMLCKKNTHRSLLFACMLLGSTLMLLCDILTQVNANALLPINAITAIFGAPIVLVLVFKYRII